MSITNILELSGTTRPQVLLGGKNDTVSTYIAAVIVDAGAVPADGATYTTIGSSTITVSTSTIPDVLRDLAFRGRALFFYNGSVKGSKALPTEMQESDNFGLYMQAKTTGAVGETVELIIKDFYANINGFNRLRTNLQDYDVYFFTSNGLEVITASQNSVQFHSIGHEKAGDNTLIVNGNMSITYRSQTGEIVPRLGVNLASLAGPLKFALTDGTPTNMTKGACNGKYTIFTEVSGTLASTIPFTAAPAAQCITWQVFRVVGDSLVAPLATQAFISTTGVLNFPTTATAGTERYVVVATNETGVYGEYYLQAVILA